VAWAVWAAWTIKPTLNPNEEGPDFFRAFFYCAAATEKTHRFAGAKKTSVMLTKKAAEFIASFS
jgi:hypothetical protein